MMCEPLAHFLSALLKPHDCSHVVALFHSSDRIQQTENVQLLVQDVGSRQQHLLMHTNLDIYCAYSDIGLESHHSV